MANHQVKSGDVVKLRSGGPEMTAQFLSNQGMKCSWFDETTLKEGYFNPNSLEVVQSFSSGNQ